MPKSIHVPRFKFDKDDIESLFDEIGDLLLSEQQRTTATFDNVDPTFQKEIFLKSGNLHLKVGPTNNEDGQIWSYLEGGTDIRFYGMVEPFEPKTATRRIDPVQGQFSGRFYNPQGFPGIEARSWNDEIIKQNLPKIVNIVNAGLVKALK